jgi:hypothetical protein
MCYKELGNKKGTQKLPKTLTSRKHLTNFLGNGQYNMKMDTGERGEDVNWFIPVHKHSKPSSLIISNSLTRSIATSYLILIINLCVDYLTMLLAAWNITVLHSNVLRTSGT